MLKAEKRNFAKTFTLELYACEFCELCVQVCPTDAIIMMKSFDVATADRRELLFDKDRLHAVGLQFAALLGHRQPPARHAVAAQGRPRRPRGPRQGGRGRGVSLEPIAFAALAVVLVASALAVVLTKNLFHSVLWLALTLTGTAGIFLTLDAEFLAAVQLLLYAGGVVTIAVFAIVVTERLVGDRITQTSRQIFSGLIIAGAVLVGVLSFVLRAPQARPRPPLAADLTRAIGDAVLTRFVLLLRAAGRALLRRPARGDLLRAPGRLAPCPPRSPSRPISILAAVLFAIGLFGVVTRRNTIGILLGIELMLNAVNINLVAFARFNGDVAGMVFTVFTISHHGGGGRAGPRPGDPHLPGAADRHRRPSRPPPGMTPAP